MTLFPSQPARDYTASQRLALIRAAREALRRDPRNVEALLAVAGLLGVDRNFGEAIPLLEKAHALRKREPDILRRLVGACNDAGNFPLGRKYAKKLVELEPRVAQNHKTYGLMTEMLGFPAAAIEAYLRADALAPGSPETQHDIGRCHGMTGEHEKAQAAYLRALELDPTYGLALFSYSSSHKFTPGEVDDFVARIGKAIPLAKDPAIHANLHYAAGKALDDAGRADEAFPWFVRANDLRRPEEPANLTAPFVNTIEAFSRDFVRSRTGFGLATRQPIFVLGMPRSGTTLTESLCAGHSKVTAGDERTVLNAIAKNMGRDSGVAGAYAGNLRSLAPAEFRQLGEEYLRQTRAIAGTTPHFTDKLPHNFLNIGLIGLILPDAAIVHCRRHPLDNCLSLYQNSLQRFHNDYKTDLIRLGMHYRQYLQLMDHWRGVFPGRILDVFYEDLVANTEWNARAVIAHLGLDWEDSVLERSQSQRSVRTASAWQVRQPVYQTSSGRWRRYEKHLGPLIDAIGPANIEAYERELAAIGDKADPKEPAA